MATRKAIDRHREQWGDIGRSGTDGSGVDISLANFGGMGMDDQKKAVMASTLLTSSIAVRALHSTVFVPSSRGTYFH